MQPSRHDPNWSSTTPRTSDAVQVTSSPQPHQSSLTVLPLPMDDKSVFLHELMAGRADGGPKHKNRGSGSNSLCSEGCDDFSDITIKDNNRDGIGSGSAGRLKREGVSSAPKHPTEIAFENGVVTNPNGATDPPSQNNNSSAPPNTNLDDLPIPVGKSIAHHHIIQNKAVYCSMDIETGGEFCGLLQLSAQLFRISDKNQATIVLEEFNEYIQPPNSAIWDPPTTAVHGLSSSSPEISRAERITQVWSNFCRFLEKHVMPSETCIFIAYNGHTCDMKWIWKLTQAPNSPCSMPPQIRFYMDPLKIIQHYKSCDLNSAQRKLESLRLDVVHQYITKTSLKHAHNSLHDDRAQTTIVTSNKFMSFIN